MSLILVVDDDRDVRETMESLIRRQGFECMSADLLESARTLIAEHAFEVIFLDVRLPDGNGLDLLPDLTSLEMPPEVIILTGNGDPDGAELAIQLGVWDYLLKPSSVKEISLTLKRALSYREEKQARSGSESLHLADFVGSSHAILSILDKAAMASRSNASTLISGETGTGKELMAKIIHDNSKRSHANFVVVDCASLTEGLVESTLFGHRKGSFTGAHNDHLGLVRMADKGTLFLDEVGEMPMALQKAFLRVLQEHRFRPVGETREVHSDFRLIAATNKDLEAMVREGAFREDLLFRLKTIKLTLPPLRERREDIPLLARFHVKRLSKRYGIKAKRMDQDILDVLATHAWPGNVRELFNVLEQAFVASGSEPTLYAKHLSSELRIKVTHSLLERARKVSNEEDPCKGSGAFSLPDKGNGMPSLKEAKGMMERQYLEQLLNRYGSDTVRMLKVSGLSRSHFYALLKKCGLTISS